MSQNFKSFSARNLAGAEVSLSDFAGKPVLIENIASLWGTTVADLTAMNGIADKFGDKVAVLGFPCNQFGHQTNENDNEFLNTLKHVRPGSGFEPKFTVMASVQVNGADAHPLFKWMRSSIKIPMDPAGDSKGLGCDDVDALILPRAGFGGTTVTLWSPVTRTDIAWNFEKFLINANGEIIARYSRFYPTAEIEKDIAALL